MWYKYEEGRWTDIEHVQLVGLESEHGLANTSRSRAAVQDILIQRSVCTIK
jgi:hypothetical protein